ncbi:MAG: hypothetical protein LUH19_09190 [Lachnospiraceae bacterium]|nr:hypothetical protein [Lachnospiraceae bacterium]
MSYFIYQILKLKDFLAWSGVVGLLFLIVSLVWAVRPKRGPLHYGPQAFFFRRSVRETLYLAGTILQLTFVVSSVAGQVTIERIHLYLAVALWLEVTVAKPGVKSSLANAAYLDFAVVVLLICNLFAGFLNTIAADIWLRLMYVLLNVFALELAFYNFFRCIQSMTGEETVRIRLPRLPIKRAGRK